MSEYLYSQTYVELLYHQTRHHELLRQSEDALLMQSIQINKPSFWDTTLFNTGNMLVSLGEKLRRNRGYLMLSEDCQ